MMTTPLFRFAIVGACAALAGPVRAHDDADVGRIQDRIDELKAEIAALKRALDDDWMTEQRAEEIRTLVHEVLADADTRTSLLQDDATAGYDRGFFVKSSDGNFTLKIQGLMQFRLVWNDTDGSTDGDDSRWGFENRRTQLSFSGTVIDPSWKYKIKGRFDRSSGEFFLQDAIITKEFDNGLGVRVGRMKLPFNRERLISDGRLLAVERSLVNAEFNLGRSEGVMVAWESDRIRAMGMISDGARQRGAALTADTEWAVTARVEGVLMGEGFAPFTDFSNFGTDEVSVLLGGALHYEADEYGPALPDPKESFIEWTIDGQVDFDHANIFAYAVGRHEDESGIDAYGFVVQGGWFLVEDDWEIFGRYEWGDSGITGEADLSVVTVGANRFFNRHTLKWTTDIGFALNEVSAIWASSGAGWRANSPGESGQVVIRSQFQLLF